MYEYHTVPCYEALPLDAKEGRYGLMVTRTVKCYVGVSSTFISNGVDQRRRNGVLKTSQPLWPLAATSATCLADQFLVGLRSGPASKGPPSTSMEWYVINRHIE